MNLFLILRLKLIISINSFTNNVQEYPLELGIGIIQKLKNILPRFALLTIYDTPSRQ